MFTQSPSRALRVIETLETGMVQLNHGLVSNAAATFGEVKESRFGREDGYEGIEVYLTLKYVEIDQRASYRIAILSNFLDSYLIEMARQKYWLDSDTCMDFAGTLRKGFKFAGI